MGVARCFDWDDYCDANHDETLMRLECLRELNPEFRCTLFAITAQSQRADELPDWVEVVPHGWEHPTPEECIRWSYGRTVELIDGVEARRPRLARGFKAPGWQISDASFKALRDRSWWVADQEYNRERRPRGIGVYEIGPDDWHGHVQNVCGNGLQETWEQVCLLVRQTETFQFCSERVKSA